MFDIVFQKWNKNKQKDINTIKKIIINLYLQSV